MHNIAITTECVADLPRELLEREEIDLIYYDVQTDRGLFRDTDEVDSENIMEYMRGGEKKAQSIVPGANEYKNFFKRKLERYDEIVHICISGATSVAFENAKLARAKLGIDGRRICLIDSGHLSSGMGLMVMAAAECRNKGMGSREIEEHLKEMAPSVSTTFLANNLEYLYYNGKVSRSTLKFCSFLQFHPVLCMRNGKLTLKNGYFGKYERAAQKYIADTLKKAKQIDLGMGFLTYAGCNHELRERIKKEIGKRIEFREFWEQQASATVSCNCGPLTFGILYVMKGVSPK